MNGLIGGRDRWLRGGLLGLVVLDLVFVHITHAVGVQWLVPLYVLTAIAPLLVGWHDRRSYKLVWNAGVLTLFVVLVHDASSSGVRFMLEDGLILAAFCQVHLINNLGRHQKPDLLFFNSFLIAVVTSFFCQDVVFAAVFAVYACVLTVTMVLGCALGHGRGVPRGWVGDGVRKAAVVLGLTVLGFVVLPRDFDREGLVGTGLVSAPLSEVGYSEEVVLGRSEQVVISNRVVMRIELLEGRPSDVPQHWRGATFAWYGRQRWHPVTRAQRFSSDVLDPLWMHRNGARWVRPGQRAVARVRVEMDGDPGPLFAPLESVYVDVAGGEAPYVAPRADGTLGALPQLFGEPPSGPTRYELRLHASRDDFGDAARHPRWPPLFPYQRLDRGDLPDRGAEIAAALATALRGAPQHLVVERMRAYLAEHYDYLLPGTRGAAGSLSEFLDGHAGGHCEYFATALALMLRSQNIPCRLVTGYCSNEWDEAGRVLTVRSRHAHAWVEVRDPAGFWYTVDATPAVTLGGTGGDSVFELAASWLRSIWDRLAAFDDSARVGAVAWLWAAPGRFLAWSGRRPGQALLLVLGVVLLLGLRVLRRRRTRDPAVESYRRALRRAGLRPAPDETPRDVLARARRGGVGEASLRRLTAATAAHEQQRYR